LVLTPALFGELSLVTRYPGRTAPEYDAMVHSRAGVSAVNNRLERLRALGLVRREPGIGNRWRYWPTPAKGKSK
jgi:hypothetical protein